MYAHASLISIYCRHCASRLVGDTSLHAPQQDMRSVNYKSIRLRLLYRLHLSIYRLHDNPRSKAEVESRAFVHHSFNFFQVTSQEPLAAASDSCMRGLGSSRGTMLSGILPRSAFGG